MLMKLEYGDVTWEGFLPGAVTTRKHPEYQVEYCKREEQWKAIFDGKALTLEKDAYSAVKCCMMHLRGRQDIASAGVADSDAVNEALRKKVQQLRDRVSVLIDEKEDAEHALNAWFDARELAHEAVDQTVLDAVKGHLRTSRCGDMDPDESDMIAAAIEVMANDAVFSDIFSRTKMPEVKVLKDGYSLPPITPDWKKISEHEWRWTLAQRQYEAKVSQSPDGKGGWSFEILCYSRHNYPSKEEAMLEAEEFVLELLKKDLKKMHKIKKSLSKLPKGEAPERGGIS